MPVVSVGKFSIISNYILKKCESAVRIERFEDIEAGR
jgi:hypothetical protein